jgi:hypothetical protein
MWQWIEHIGFLIGLASTVGAIIWAFRYRRKITATAVHSRLKFMPGLDEKIVQITGEGSREGIRTNIERLLRQVYRNSDFWEFAITNQGRKEIRDLNLHLPFDGYYKTDLSPEALPFKRTILLGSLRSGDSTRVDVWATKEFAFSNDRDFRVTHADDVIRVQLGRTVYGRLGRVAEMLQEDDGWWSRWILFMGVLFVLLVAVEIHNHVSIQYQRPTTTMTNP